MTTCGQAELCSAARTITHVRVFMVEEVRRCCPCVCALVLVFAPRDGCWVCGYWRRRRNSVADRLWPAGFNWRSLSLGPRDETSDSLLSFLLYCFHSVYRETTWWLLGYLSKYIFLFTKYVHRSHSFPVVCISRLGTGQVMTKPNSLSLTAENSGRKRCGPTHSAQR